MQTKVVSRGKRCLWRWLHASIENHASHELVVKLYLSCLEHRGVVVRTGILEMEPLMTAIPWELLSQWLTEQGKALPEREICAVGMVFTARRASGNHSSPNR